MVTKAAGGEAGRGPRLITTRTFSSAGGAWPGRGAWRVTHPRGTESRYDRPTTFIPNPTSRRLRLATSSLFPMTLGTPRESGTDFGGAAGRAASAAGAVSGGAAASAGNVSWKPIIGPVPGACAPPWWTTSRSLTFCPRAALRPGAGDCRRTRSHSTLRADSMGLSSGLNPARRIAASASRRVMLTTSGTGTVLRSIGRRWRTPAQPTARRPARAKAMMAWRRNRQCRGRRARSRAEPSAEARQHRHAPNLRLNLAPQFQQYMPHPNRVRPRGEYHVAQRGGVGNPEQGNDHSAGG